MPQSQQAIAAVYAANLLNQGHTTGETLAFMLEHFPGINPIIAQLALLDARAATQNSGEFYSPYDINPPDISNIPESTAATDGTITAKVIIECVSPADAPNKYYSRIIETGDNNYPGGLEVGIRNFVAEMAAKYDNSCDPEGGYNVQIAYIFKSPVPLSDIF